MAIARALAAEPTGNLDTASGAEVPRIFDDLNARGITIVFVTHDPEVSERARCIVYLRDGLIESDTVRPRDNGHS